MASSEKTPAPDNGRTKNKSSSRVSSSTASQKPGSVFSASPSQKSVYHGHLLFMYLLLTLVRSLDHASLSPPAAPPAPIYPLANQQQAGDTLSPERRDEIRFLTSFAGGAAGSAGSSRRPEAVELSSSSWDDSTPTAGGDDDGEEFVELEADTIRQKVYVFYFATIRERYTNRYGRDRALSKMRRDRENPRAPKPARKRVRDEESTRAQAGSSKRTSEMGSPGKKREVEIDAPEEV